MDSDRVVGIDGVQHFLIYAEIYADGRFLASEASTAPRLRPGFEIPAQKLRVSENSGVSKNRKMAGIIVVVAVPFIHR